MTTTKKGFIQIYTGNGKGKTTAALGLALRAAGAGYKSYFVQFMKQYPYSELESLKYLKEYIKVKQVCSDDFVLKKELPSPEEKQRAKKELLNIIDLMLEDEYDIFILDEVNVSIYFGLIELKDLIKVIKSKPESKELILTGRYCPKEIMELADLITEMKEIKHYYSKGVLSRKGIDS